MVGKKEAAGPEAFRQTKDSQRRSDVGNWAPELCSHKATAQASLKSSVFSYQLKLKAAEPAVSLDREAGSGVGRESPERCREAR